MLCAIRSPRCVWACEGSTKSLIHGTVARLVATARVIDRDAQGDALEAAFAEDIVPDTASVEAVLDELAAASATATAAR